MRRLPRRAPGMGAALSAGLLFAAGPVGCFGGFGGGGVPWNGTPFSADLVDLRHPAKPPTRVYIGDGRVRMESTGPGDRSAFVFDPGHGTTLVINDKARTYIDGGIFTPVVSAGFAPLLRLFRPMADGDPCTVWNGTVDGIAAFVPRHTSGTPPHFTCRATGTESVNGRPAHKWLVTADHTDGGNSGPSTVWIDDRLHVISRSRDANGEMEMRNVHEGAPPADLFVPPSGYRRIGVTDFLRAAANAGRALGGGATTSGAGDSTGGGEPAGDVADSPHGGQR